MSTEKYVEGVKRRRGMLQRVWNKEGKNAVKRTNGTGVSYLCCVCVGSSFGRKGGFE